MHTISRGKEFTGPDLPCERMMVIESIFWGASTFVGCCQQIFRFFVALSLVVLKCTGLAHVRNFFYPRESIFSSKTGTVPMGSLIKTTRINTKHSSIIERTGPKAKKTLILDPFPALCYISMEIPQAGDVGSYLRPTFVDVVMENRKARPVCVWLRPHAKRLFNALIQCFGYENILIFSILPPPILRVLLDELDQEKKLHTDCFYFASDSSHRAKTNVSRGSNTREKELQVQRPPSSTSPESTNETSSIRHRASVDTHELLSASDVLSISSVYDEICSLPSPSGSKCTTRRPSVCASSIASPSISADEDPELQSSEHIPPLKRVIWPKSSTGCPLPVEIDSIHSAESTSSNDNATVLREGTTRKRASADTLDHSSLPSHSNSSHNHFQPVQNVRGSNGDSLTPSASFSIPFSLQLIDVDPRNILVLSSNRDVFEGSCFEMNTLMIEPYNPFVSAESTLKFFSPSTWSSAGKTARNEEEQARIQEMRNINKDILKAAESVLLALSEVEDVREIIKFSFQY